MQRSQGIPVPSGRAFGGRPGYGGPNAGRPAYRGYGYGGSGRFGMGVRGGTAWIGILVALLALRFLLVDSFVGTHAAVFWVLGIGGILLVARVFSSPGSARGDSAASSGTDSRTIKLGSRRATDERRARIQPDKWATESRLPALGKRLTHPLAALGGMRRNRKFNEGIGLCDPPYE